LERACTIAITDDILVTKYCEVKLKYMIKYQFGKLLTTFID